VKNQTSEKMLKFVFLKAKIVNIIKVDITLKFFVSFFRKYVFMNYALLIINDERTLSF